MDNLANMFKTSKFEDKIHMFRDVWNMLSENEKNLAYDMILNHATPENKDLFFRLIDNLYVHV